MLTWSVSRLFRGEYLVSQLRDNNTYNRLLDNPSVWQSMTKGNLSEGQIKQIIGQSIPAETFYGFLEGYLTNYTNWLTGRSTSLAYSYDMSTVRQRGKEAIAQKILVSYDDLPDCQATQLKNWSFSEGVPECHLANTSSSSPDIIRLANQQAEEFVSQVPEKIEIKASSGQEPVRAAVSRVFWGFWALWGVTGVWLLLFLLIQRRKAFFTLGVTFIIAGLIAIGFNFFLWDWLARTVTDYLTGNAAIQDVLPLVNDIIRQLTDTIKTNMGVYGVVSVILGLGSFILAAIFRRRRLDQSKIALN